MGQENRRHVISKLENFTDPVAKMSESHRRLLRGPGMLLSDVCWVRPSANAMLKF